MTESASLAASPSMKTCRVFARSTVLMLSKQSRGHVAIPTTEAPPVKHRCRGQVMQTLCAHARNTPHLSQCPDQKQFITSMLSQPRLLRVARVLLVLPASGVVTVAFLANDDRGAALVLLVAGVDLVELAALAFG